MGLLGQIGNDDLVKLELVSLLVWIDKKYYPIKSIARVHDLRKIWISQKIEQII